MSTEAAWYRKLLAACRQLEILPGVGYRVKETQNGRTLEITKIAAIQSGGGSTLVVTGEYDPSRTYSLMQIALITMGSNAGTYVYINAAPSSGNAPYAGGGWWVQLPMGQLGVWM
jgi:hypothetical protein